MNIFDVIERPVLSEKSFEGIKDKNYTFRVHPKATKDMVKNAVEQIFKVKVERVNIAVYNGKPKRQGRSEGTTSKWKKAYVKLTADSKAIEFFESLQ